MDTNIFEILALVADVALIVWIVYFFFSIYAILKDSGGITHKDHMSDHSRLDTKVHGLEVDMKNVHSHLFGYRPTTYLDNKEMCDRDKEVNYEED